MRGIFLRLSFSRNTCNQLSFFNGFDFFVYSTSCIYVGNASQEDISALPESSTEDESAMIEFEDKQVEATSARSSLFSCLLMILSPYTP